LTTFKEQLQKDIDIFMNLDEFAETHMINGKECTAILEGLTTKEQFIQLRESKINFDGISGETFILHVAVSALDEVPKEGLSIEVDGETYVVSSSAKEMGMATITMERDVVP